MGCDTKLFVRNGIDILALGKYIKEKYGDCEIVDSKSDISPCYSVYFSDDNGEARRIWLYTHNSQVVGEAPVSVIVGKSCSLVLSYWGNSVKIFQDIAKNFGGGYIQENDCGLEDGTDEWYYVEGKDNAISDVETKIFKLVQNAKDKGDLSSVSLTKFIIEHVDEIKSI